MLGDTTVINYYEEKSQDPDKVVEVFIRANTGGKTLEYSDILLSTATAKWKNLNARDEIYSFTDDTNTIRPGYNFGKDFVLKGCLYLTDGLPIRYKVRNFTRSNLEKIEENWSNIKAGIENTIRLVSKFGFNDKNITSAMALLPIAYYLMKLDRSNYVNSSDRNDVSNQTLIQKWLILVLLKNSFGGSSDTTLSNLRAELGSMSDYSSFPFDELNKRLGIRAEFTDLEMEELLQRNYRTRYSFLILSLLYPNRDWKDSVYHEDHIFPKSEFTAAKLRGRGYDDKRVEEYRKYYNTIVNLQLLTDTENLEKKAKDFESWIVTRHANFKDTHKIPVMDSYHFDDFLDFVTERGKILRTVLASL